MKTNSWLILEKKLKLLILFLKKKCLMWNSDTSLPSDNSLCSLRFSTEGMLKIINNLDSDKAHSSEDISVRMLKLCGSSVCRPLQIICKSCLEKGKVSTGVEKSNVPVHKKNDKQLVKKYYPISLLPVCGRSVECILYNSLFNSLNQNYLTSPAQSGFRPGDSCINQLLSITHEIYYSMDKGCEIYGVFLDISKGFDKVWHDGLIFK